MDLIGCGSGNKLRISDTAWFFILEAAVAFGWEPEGTGPSDKTSQLQEWDGNYLSNDWQKVSNADAEALAAGLDLAIAKLRGDGSRGGDYIEAEDLARLTSIVRAAMVEGGDELVELLDVRPQSVTDLAEIKELAGFARQGSFLIT